MSKALKPISTKVSNINYGQWDEIDLLRHG